MTKSFLAIAALLTMMTPSVAHQIWIEQAEGQNAVVRFGEFGENLREASPGLLDKFVKPAATLISSKGEQKSDATKAANGFTLPFQAAAGDSILAEDASYPLYVWKQQDKEVLNRYYPAARLITNFAAQQPQLTFDLVPAGQEGHYKMFLKNQPKAKIKVTLVTQSGWSKEAHTDEQGLVKFDMPWQGTYVAEVSLNDRNAGERTGVKGVEKFDAVSYATTVTYLKSEGIAPLPAGPPATPSK
jgi:hypothetical protein